MSIFIIGRPPKSFQLSLNCGLLTTSALAPQTLRLYTPLRVNLAARLFFVYYLSTFLLVPVLRQLSERFFQDERARWPRCKILGLKQRFGVDWVLFERATPPGFTAICPAPTRTIRSEFAESSSRTAHGLA